MMIRKVLLGVVLAASLLPATSGAAEMLRPFVLAKTTGGDMESAVASTKSSLRDAGFTIVGEYDPYRFNDDQEWNIGWQAHVIVVTSDALKQAAAATPRGGYAAGQRVAVTKVDDQIQISYANPPYVANAYHLDSDLSGVAAKLEQALGKQKAFNAEDGMSAEDLREYHYMFGMEYFGDPYELASHDSYQQAVEVVESNLEKGVGGAEKVYRIDIPGKSQTVFGVGRHTVEAGGDKYADDEFIMHTVDFKDLKGTAYLPYEIMVDGSEVVALHMRFRMAVHYPDLGMMGSNSFMSIMSSPKANNKFFKKVAGAGEEF